VKLMGVQCPGTQKALTGDYVVPCKTSDGRPAFATVLEWIDGQTANKLAVTDEAAMLGHLGRVLATLHAAPQPEAKLGLQDVASDAYLQCFMHWPEGTSCDDGLREVKEVAGETHELVAFLSPRSADCLKALSAPDLPTGLLHGDPFLDNLMVGSAGATLLDWDEAAMGPLALDLACAVVGGCFDEAGDLRETRLHALLQSYVQIRPLLRAEVLALPALMRANALLVAWYRWRAFHIEVADAPAEAKASFKEMVKICQSLEQGPVIERVCMMLGALSGIDGRGGAAEEVIARKRPAAAVPGGVAKKPSSS